MPPFEHTNIGAVWTWTPPAEGETVPDYPPTDLTPYLRDVRLEHDDEPEPPASA